MLLQNNNIYIFWLKEILLKGLINIWVPKYLNFWILFCFVFEVSGLKVRVKDIDLPNSNFSFQISIISFPTSINQRNKEKEFFLETYN